MSVPMGKAQLNEQREQNVTSAARCCLSSYASSTVWAS